jgi:hypothetical protein
MTDQLHDDELFSLVRRALPEIDADTLSLTGAQAQVVLERLFAADRLVVPGQHRILDDENEGARPPRQGRRRAWLIVASTGLAAVVAALLVAALIASPPISPRPISAQSHGVIAVRARLLAALDEAGDDVVQVVGLPEALGSGATSCPATRWYFPFDAQPGGEFRERVEGDCPGFAASSISDSAIDITVETVTPYVLPTPASLSRQIPAVHVSESDGVSVCGIGSFSGYRGAAPNGTTWQASGETLRVPAPATPELLRSELQAGSWQLVGNTTVGGAPAIELSVLSPPASQTGSFVSQKLWVNPSTYLPIREVTSYEMKPIPSNAPPSALPTTRDEVVQNFIFLPPTPANLALLKVTVPRGLAQVPAGAALTTRSCADPFAGGPTTSSAGTGKDSSTTTRAG